MSIMARRSHFELQAVLASEIERFWLNYFTMKAERILIAYPAVPACIGVAGWVTAKHSSDILQQDAPRRP
jgi:hypothetical protein